MSKKILTKEKILTKKAIRELIDELGAVNEQRKALEKEEARLKTALSPFLSEEGVYMGREFSVEKTEGETKRLDRKALEEDQGLAFVEQYLRASSYSKLTPRRLVMVSAGRKSRDNKTR